MGTAIDEILERRRTADKTAAEPTPLDGKYYSILVGEGVEEKFLELQFRDGLRLCLAYSDLKWFHYVPEDHSIDLEFGGFLVSLKGRGMLPTLFNGLKQKRVNWIREAASEMEDVPDNPTFIEEIILIPPQNFTEGAAE